MGEVKDPKGAKNVPIRMRVGGKNYIISSVSAEDRTQVKFDLMLDIDFKLFHDLKDAYIYFMGYIDDDPVSGAGLYMIFVTRCIKRYSCVN